MKHFLTCANNINDSKKIRVYINNDLAKEVAVYDPIASHAEKKSEVPPSESNSYK